MQEWPLQDAKNKFSQLVNTAIAEGPQMVTRRGEEAVVVVPADTYRRLTRKNRTLLDVLQSAPTAELNLDRNSETIREIDL
ncbi:MAG: type II toxin-antitoxin system Phd/YefM family antitoxin [Deltaproteobacteria bacterium]|nr:type II toxin-antitoxin system Phd/YefM family antitoxin [Deltaproteobacteria bacterium]MBN2672084.1 type II toxin-antitoxin system Phd/YefM family antitoxin [Deltaproteobacteria bacterium]